MVAMSGISVVQQIDAVDAFARTLYIRTTQSTVPSLSTDVSQAVRNLHQALREFRIEAADPNSRLNASESSTYVKQLNSIIKDSQTTLKQLELVLDLNSRGGGPYADSAAESINAVQTKLLHQKTVIEAFLDLVRHGDKPSRRRGPSLDTIKGKVDAIGRRLFRRDSNKSSTGDDKLWRKFKAELIKEGFSSKVLDEHEDVLRAYIQEMQSVPSMKDGVPPTVQGLLELDGTSVPAPAALHARHMTFPLDHGKTPASTKTDRLRPDQSSHPALAQELSYDPRSWASPGEAGSIVDSFTLISTRDLLLMDSLSSDVAGLHLNSSPTQADAPSFQPIMSGALPLPEIRLPQPTAPRDIPQSKHLGVEGAAPHVYGSSAPPAYGGASMPRLAPDSFGRDIPMHAEWTKINRSLVSPEALHRVGVRYEARPGYVAVLGRLTLDQVTQYARLSAECRAARRGVPPMTKHHSYDVTRHERTSSESSPDENFENDKDSDRSDMSDADDEKASGKKGAKSYPVIVNPPEKSKASPSSTVMPKPILKNKNPNHVRFDPEPYEVAARQDKDSRESRDSASRKSRDRDEKDRDDHHRRREDREKRRRDSDPTHDDKNRRDRDRDRDRDREHDGHRSHHHDRDRRDDRRRERSAKKDPWAEALGVVGIGGAAASLLGVLAEAAMGG